jgi:hypothetical protein
MRSGPILLAPAVAAKIVPPNLKVLNVEAENVSITFHSTSMVFAC